MVGALAGRTALVTGAASGIGRAGADALRAEGVNVIGLDLRAGEGPVPLLACDLSREEDVVTAVAEASRRLGGLDIVVNNAGILEEAPLGSVTAAHIDRMFAVNVRGAILVTREALPQLRDGGRIINVASELAYLGRAEASVYVATKAAINNFTKGLAQQLAPRGIRVNAVAPGPTDTPLLGFDHLSEAQRRAETAHPLGRIGRPEEVAAAVVFLAGPGATLFTGQCLGANGGAAMT